MMSMLLRRCQGQELSSMNCGILLVLVISVYAVSVDCISGCNNKWEKMFENAENGTALFGSKRQLVQAALNGASIRVSLNEGYFTSVQNVQTVSNNLCAQALFHVSKSGYYTFNPNAYWWFLEVCTTGNVHMSRWYVGKHASAGETKTTYRIEWFVRNTGCSDNLQDPVISIAKTGDVVFGSIDDVISAVDNGADIKVVDWDLGYSTPFDNVEYDRRRGIVSGQSLWHISSGITGSHISFQDDVYWWFTIWSTTGKVDTSRWSLGVHVSKGQAAMYEPQEWYSDACWTLAYHHDANGVVIDGSLDFLRAAVESGQKVKLIKESHSFVPDQVNIRNGHVHGHFLNYVSKASIDTYKKRAYWYWQGVSTTGKQRTIRYFVGNGQVNGGQEVSRTEGKWFVSTRRFRRVLSHDASGKVALGSKAELINAIKNGAEVRIRLPEKSLHFEPDNLAIVGDDVGAMHIRSVELEPLFSPSYDYQFEVPAYWNFKIVSTTGRMSTARWKVGEFDSRRSANEQFGVEWFVSG